MLKVLLLLFAAAHAGAPVKDFLSFSIRGNLVSDGRRLVYTSQREGVFNLWEVENVTGVPRRVTAFSEDNARLMTSVQLRHGAAYYNYEPFDAGNPQQLPEAPRNQIHRVHLGTDKLTVFPIAAVMGEEAVSPDGSSVVVWEGRSAVLYSLDDKQTRVVLFTLQDQQGQCSEFTWSPHAPHSLAFSNDRGDHGYIGVLDTLDGTGRVRWVSPSFDTDQTPRWDDAGKRIAFMRTRPRFDETERQTGTSLSLLVVSTDDLNNATVIYSDSKVGLPINYGFGNRRLTWVNDLLVFPCERSMWLHVATVDTRTHEYHDLIGEEQECEVQDYIVSSGLVYVSHNCRYLVSRGISVYTAEAQGTERVIIQTGEGVVAGVSDAGYGMAIVDNKLCYLRSEWNEAAQLFCDTDKLTDPEPSVPYDEFVKPESVTFQSADGLWKIHSRVYKGRNVSDDAPGPGIVFTHGGPMRQMYAAMHPSWYYATLYAKNQWLASTGVTVIDVNYRMGIGRGREFRLCLPNRNCGPFGGAEYQDVRSGGQFLQALKYVDELKVGITGLSYGGLNTLQALARNSDIFAAGAANAPVFNWISEDRFDGAGQTVYNPIEPGLAIRVGPESNQATPARFADVQENIKDAYDASPISMLSRFKSPVLLIHGDDDRNVDFQESVGAMRALEKRGVHVESLVFPGEIHGLSLHSNQLVAAEAEEAFLRRVLANPNPTRSTKNAWWQILLALLGVIILVVLVALCSRCCRRKSDYEPLEIQ